MQTTVMERVVGYDDHGSGVPLVLIHGYPLNRQIWQSQVEGLSDVARVIAPDLRGFGESNMPAGEVTIDTYADDVRELLDALGVRGRAIIAGLSMGGYVALAYLRRYPSHVGGLILANTKATPDSIEGKAGRDRNIAIARDKGAAEIAAGMLPKVFSPLTYNTNAALVAQGRAIMESASVPGIVAALEAMRDRPDSTGTLLELATPVLVIAGQDDQLMTAADAQTMAQAARDSRLITIPAAGHLSPLEQPAAFNAAVHEFLYGQPWEQEGV